MELDLILKELKSFATQEEKSYYQKQGSGNHVYGVSLSNIRDLANRIGISHALALSLWETEIIDARILSCLLLDSSVTPSEQIDKMASEIEYFHLGDFFSKFISTTRFALEKAETFISSEKEMTKRMGYILIAILALQNKELDDGVFLPFLYKISLEFDSSSQHVKEGMNNALVEIGLRNTRLKLKTMETLRGIISHSSCPGEYSSSFDPTEILVNHF